MADVHSYLTITGQSESLYKEKGSKFIGYAFPVRDEPDFKDGLARIKKTHFQARHHCFALVLGEDGGFFKASDDGEPNGTAGRSILAPIQGKVLTNTAVVVVRYFGGTKLGKGGLVRAYGTAAKEALKLATVKEVHLLTPLTIQATISVGEKFRGHILELGGEIVGAEYGNGMSLRFNLPKKHVARLVKQCTDQGIDIKSDQAS